MLPLLVPGGEFWDERKEEFSYKKDVKVRLEHSLISISKWESIWCVPFVGTPKTAEQAVSYLECMSLDPGIDSEVFARIAYNKDLSKKVNDYISSPMTASTIREDLNKKHSSQRITSELIYYWMSAFNIPFEAEKWHLARLIMLIRIASEENKPKKKQSQKELMSEYQRINEMNKAKFKSKG